jgi:protein-S-isoprenylcysteine O-methyltransferase Ste14
MGELVWVVLLLSLAADLLVAALLKSDVFRIGLLQSTPAASAGSLAIGAALLLVGCVLGYRSHEEFKRAISARGSIDHLINDGLYRHVRHPFYLSLIVISLSLAVLLRSSLLLAAWVVVAILLVVEARAEESGLVERFRQEYLDYQHRTGMFLPWLRRRG